VHETSAAAAAAAAVTTDKFSAVGGESFN